MLRTLRAVRFLFVGPLILVMLFVISRMTADGGDWFKWVVLGIGIAWVIALIRVLQAVVVVGGLAALGTWLWRRGSQPQSPPQSPPPPPGAAGGRPGAAGAQWGQGQTTPPPPPPPETPTRNSEWH